MHLKLVWCLKDPDDDPQISKRPLQPSTPKGSHDQKGCHIRYSARLFVSYN